MRDGGDGLLGFQCFPGLCPSKPGSLMGFEVETQGLFLSFNDGRPCGLSAIGMRVFFGERLEMRMGTARTWMGAGRRCWWWSLAVAHQDHTDHPPPTTHHSVLVEGRMGGEGRG